MPEAGSLRVEQRGAEWQLVGTGAETFGLINEFLGYLADRAYSPRTVRSYAYDLLAFARWLLEQRMVLEAVTPDELLRFLAACRTALLPGRRGDNVFSLWDGRNCGYSATTINRRLAAISGMFAYRAMRHPELHNPVPRGREARRSAKGERSGLLGHLSQPRPRSGLRLREPRRLPRGLQPGEAQALLGSFRTLRDRAIAGLMLLSGLRSAEVLSLQVRDVDISRGWVRVVGKGDKERRVSLDPEVAGLVQTYLPLALSGGLSRTWFLLGLATELSRGDDLGNPQPIALGLVQRHAVILCIELAILSKDVETADWPGGFQRLRHAPTGCN